MITAIYEGILLGLVLAFSFGPAFFALINTGIRHGFKSGFALALGIILSDLALVTACFLLLLYGASDLVSNPKNQKFIGIIGGIVLIVYGAFHFAPKNPTEKDPKQPIEIKSPRPLFLIVKGFFLNLFNPFVWIFWLATTTAVSSKFSFSLLEVAAFFGGTLGVVFGTDLLKAFVANKIKNYITPKVMRYANIITGIILVVFGLYLIYNVFFKVENGPAGF